MATREDATLLVQVLQWGSASGVDEALRSIFMPESGPSVEAESKVLMFGEAIGTLVKHDLLDGPLVRDLIWVEGIWARVKDHALKARANEGEPRLYENFELLATSAAR
jgi:hypothetical protein